MHYFPVVIMWYHMVWLWPMICDFGHVILSHTLPCIVSPKIYIYINNDLAILPSCYKSPRKEIVFHAFEHLIQNLKLYNEVEI